MKRLEDELTYLEEKGKRLEQDSEMLNLQATVSGLSTRLRTVLAQALAKRTEIEVKTQPEIFLTVFCEIYFQTFFMYLVDINNPEAQMHCCLCKS